MSQRSLLPCPCPIRHLVTAIWSCSLNEQPAEKANCNSKNNSRNNNHGGNSSTSPLGVFLIKSLLYFLLCSFVIFGEFLPGLLNFLNIPVEFLLVLAFSIRHTQKFLFGHLSQLWSSLLKRLLSTGYKMQMII